MKKIIFFLLCAIAFCGCSKDDDEVAFTLSATELAFVVEGGEQIVNVVTDGKYDCSYSEEWILVRQQKDKIRVIVEANETEAERTALISMSCNGEPRQQIKVTQAGIQFSLETTTFDVPAKDSELAIPISSNAKISFDCDEDWLEVSSTTEGLNVLVSRNYKMSGRSGRIVLLVGEVAKEVTINQEASTWFDSFEMVEVEGGTFFMGAQRNNSNSENYDESAYEVESPIHSVSLDCFLIGRFEVTQEQWLAAMGSNPSTVKGDNLPVETVTWDEVQEFIAALNTASGHTYRLPTEAEWEYAARGGNKSEGYKFSGYSVAGACAWYYSNSNGTTHEVGTKDSNELGIYDMSGNVREWCSDWFEYYSSSAVTNPQGPANGSGKVNRGGSWTTPAVNCRITYRQTNYKYESAQDLGFRLVLVKE